MRFIRRERDKIGSLALGETLSTLRRYLIQETLEPLKRAGKALAYGLGAAVLAGIGLVIVLLGVLRLLQGETGSAFAGNFVFVPYLLTAIVAIAIVGGLAYGLIRRAPRRTRSSR